MGSRRRGHSKWPMWNCRNSSGGEPPTTGPLSFCRESGNEARSILLIQSLKSSRGAQAPLASAKFLLSFFLIYPITADAKQSRRISKEACVDGKVRYKSGLEGIIIYINTTLVKDLTEDI
jgi:hypothetical protein